MSGIARASSTFDSSTTRDERARAATQFVGRRGDLADQVGEPIIGDLIRVAPGE